jgi:hypothetical protein
MEVEMILQVVEAGAYQWSDAFLHLDWRENAKFKRMTSLEIQMK